MPKLKLSGGDKIEVSRKVAKNIAIWKDDKNIPRDRLIDVGKSNFIELGQVKGILNDYCDIEKEESDNRLKNFLDKKRDWEEYEKKCRNEDVETKARRTIKSGAFVCFKSRLNEGKIEGELFDKLMIRIIQFFEKNPNEYWCESKVYDDLIPRGETIEKSKATGWKKIGEIINEKSY